MGEVSEAALVGDGVDGFVGGGELDDGVFDAALVEVGGDGFAGMFFELTAHVAFADGETLGEGV